MEYSFDVAAAAATHEADLCFVHICDTHVSDAESAEILASAVSPVNAIGPDFVLLGGDIANHGNPESYGHIHEALSGLDVPCHLQIGNHDFVGGKDSFAEHMGPLNFAFDVNDYHIICLDSTGRTSLTWEGLFSGQTIAWLESHLCQVPADAPLILFTHHGIWSEQPHDPKRNLLWDCLNWRPVHDALEGRKLILACAGHAHDLVRQQWGNTVMLWTGVLSTNRANHVDLAPGFRVVWVRGTQVDSEWVPCLD